MRGCSWAPNPKMPSQNFSCSHSTRGSDSLTPGVHACFAAVWPAKVAHALRRPMRSSARYDFTPGGTIWGPRYAGESKLYTEMMFAMSPVLQMDDDSVGTAL